MGRFTLFLRTKALSIQHNKGFSWFHQCGSSQEEDRNYYGNQFFEVWSVTDENNAKRMAEIIAKKIGTNIENGG